MRIALISDIHGNGVALETVLNNLKSEKIDHIVCLGDVATDGPQPHQVITQLKDLDCSVVLGNMDFWMLNPTPPQERMSRFKEIQFWGRNQLTTDDLDFLKTFQKTITLSLDDKTDLLCYHGCPESNEHGIGYGTPNEDIEQMLCGHQAFFFVGGHTHRQMLRRYGDLTILNPGSVGAPMNQKEKQSQANQETHPMWAEFAIVESNNNTLRTEFCRVPIDINLLINSVNDSNMPNAEYWLSVRYGYTK